MGEAHHYVRLSAIRLANIVDRVLPYGSIMAGDWQKDVDWKKFKKNKK